MKKVMFTCLLSLFWINVKGQQLPGSQWLIRKNYIVENQDTALIFEIGGNNNLFDLSILSNTFYPDNTYDAMAIDGSSITGTWQKNATTLMFDNEVGYLDSISPNEFILYNDFFLLDTSTNTFSVPAVYYLEYIRSAPLPIEFIMLKLENSGSKNKIIWEVNEKNVTYYTLLRKDEYSDHFRPVATVSSTGDGQNKHYEYLDEKGYGTIYYKILINYVDGTVDYSNIVSINNNMMFVGRIFPMPVSDNLTIEIATPEEEQFMVTIFDVLGKGLATESYSVARGNSQIQVEMGAYSTGTYFFEIFASNKRIAVLRVPKI